MLAGVVFGAFVLAKYMYSYGDLADEVYDGGDYILVKKGSTELRIEIDDIRSAIKYKNSVGYVRVKIELKDYTKIGKVVVFKPKDSADSKGGTLYYDEKDQAELDRARAIVQRLKPLAAQSGHTIAQLAVAWVNAQPGITGAIVGSRRPAQIEETALAGDWTLRADELAAIAAVLAEIE